MKFMKLGSKPDLFQSYGENTRSRHVATDVATDMIVNVGDVKFHLHKFPLLSKSAHLQKLLEVSGDAKTHELEIHDIPGGPAAFEICAKFCYGMTVTLNAYNVLLTLYAAEYLQMSEATDKGNLVYKIQTFLNSAVFKTWKDSIIVLQTTNSLVPRSDEPKVVNLCLDSIATKASMDASKVDWSYSHNGTRSRKQLSVPKDWWVEDLCDLSVGLYKRVMTTIKSKGKVGLDVFGESLRVYTQRKLPWFGQKGCIRSEHGEKTRSLIETIISLLPNEKSCDFCHFLVRLLQVSVLLNCSEILKRELVRKIGQQLQNASVDDIVVLDVGLVQELVGVFMIEDQGGEFVAKDEFLEVKCVDFDSKVNVAKLVDCYLVEIAKDPNLSLSKFVDLADLVSGLSRSSHDGIYRAIDMFLKEHRGISKIEKKRMCRLMDCRKLTADACRHAVRNERLPLRVVVQAIFFDQIRAPGGTLLEPLGSHEGSRSTTTNADGEWGPVPTSEELVSLGFDGIVKDTKSNKALMSRRVLMKMFSGIESGNESSGTSGSLCSTNVEDMKSRGNP